MRRRFGRSVRKLSTCPGRLRGCRMNRGPQPPWRRNFLPYSVRFESPLKIELERTASASQTTSETSEASPALQLNLIQRGETANCVWDASLVLGGYLLNLPESDLKGKRVIEIGAGTGIPSLVAASRGASVVATELGEELDLLQANIAANNIPNVKSAELFWGTDPSHLAPPYEVILGADIVYEIQLFDQLILSLKQLAGPTTVVYLALEHRWKDIEGWFFEGLGREFRIAATVPHAQMHPTYRHPNIDIYILQKLSNR